MAAGKKVGGRDWGRGLVISKATLHHFWVFPVSDIALQMTSFKKLSPMAALQATRANSGRLSAIAGGLAVLKSTFV